jgi:hypothetical protein
MIIVTLAALAFIGYVVLTLVTARLVYRAIRPYREPLSCTTGKACRKHGEHYYVCYRRVGNGLADTTNQAAGLAALAGLLWCIVLPAMATRHFITAGAPALPEETRAQITRLEAENRRLLHEQQQESQAELDDQSKYEL